MERWNGRVALVMGASTDVGISICSELVKYGLRVFGCGRDLKNILALAENEEIKSAPGILHPIQSDLTHENDIHALFDEIDKRSGRIDICINNIGLGEPSNILTGKICDWKNMLEENVLTPCICSRKAIVLMMEKNIRDGQIIQIFSKPPGTVAPFNFYYGTKSMVRSVTHGLRRKLTELNTGIRLAIISSDVIESENLAKPWIRNIIDVVNRNTIKCLEPKDIVDMVIYILKSPPQRDVNDVLMQHTENF